MLSLNPASLDWALKHALHYRDTDVFPEAFEFSALEYSWETVRSELQAANLLEWRVRPHRSMLAPKGRYAFRVVTQLDPIDFILFTALLYEIGEELERSRLPQSAETVFSHRFQPAGDGRMYDPKSGYASYQQQTLSILRREPQLQYVCVTDIADFYNRIYVHRLENALDAATARRNHVLAIRNLLKGWNETETFGIPVGSAASRLLAEITIADVDEALKARGVNFVRYNDDYRIFGRTQDKVYSDLVFLADHLYGSHGLTLAPRKTTILSAATFRHHFLSTPESREVDSLHARFERLVHELGLANRYTEIEYEDLESDQQILVDSLNLVALFEDEIGGKRPDLAVLRFALRRLGQLGDTGLVDIIFANLEKFHPLIPDVIEYYLIRLAAADPSLSAGIAKKLLEVLKSTAWGEQEYYRMWLLYPFSISATWDHEDQFLSLLSSSTGLGARRKLLLALGRAGQRHWFQKNWRALWNESPWTRRAFLAGASCLTRDARGHWYRSLESRLDLLEKAVAKWADANPFRGVVTP